MKQKLLDYVVQHLDDIDRERAWRYIERRYPLPCDVEDKIQDLCEEFSADNDLYEGWWLEIFSDAEDVFLELD